MQVWCFSDPKSTPTNQALVQNPLLWDSTESQIVEYVKLIVSIYVENWCLHQSLLQRGVISIWPLQCVGARLNVMEGRVTSRTTYWSSQSAEMLVCAVIQFRENLDQLFASCPRPPAKNLQVDRNASDSLNNLTFDGGWICWVSFGRKAPQREVGSILRHRPAALHEDLYVGARSK
jgi:hypothetical protein